MSRSGLILPIKDYNVAMLLDILYLHMLGLEINVALCDLCEARKKRVNTHVCAQIGKWLEKLNIVLFSFHAFVNTCDWLIRQENGENEQGKSLRNNSKDRKKITEEKEGMFSGSKRRQYFYSLAGN